MYLVHVARSRVLGGAKVGSRKRYESVFAKFLPFATGRGLTGWNLVTAGTLKEYTSRLES